MLSNKHILVTGVMGKSGLAAVRLCRRLGALVYLSDRRTGDLPSDLGGDDILDLRPRDDEGLLDEHDIHMIVTAPGVPLANPLFRLARERGIPVYGESDLALHLMTRGVWKKPPLSVGITGTDGKSTTVALLAHLIEKACQRRAIPCGNYGVPLSDIVFDEAIASNHAVLVVECSSFQLEPLEFFHPAVSVILNVARDHMDRYEGMEDYFAAKLNILKNQNGSDLFLAPREIIQAATDVLSDGNKGNPRIQAIEPARSSDLKGVIDYDGPLLSADEAGIRGVHNLTNIRFALAVLRDLERRKELTVDRDRLTEALRSFSGLPHRMEEVGQKEKIRFINDSKATTVQAVKSALQSFPPHMNIHLLIGGRDKGGDFETLMEFVERVHIYPFGEAADRISQLLNGKRTFSDLSEAFESALSFAKNDNGESVILLSPGCSSYDAFTSFEKRGDYFRDLVKQWLFQNS